MQPETPIRRSAATGCTAIACTKPCSRRAQRSRAATVHFADDHYDTGPIILQEAVAVESGDTPESLAARVQEVERRLVPEAIRLIADGRLAIDDRHVRVRNGS